ncbi:MAG: cysteine desulfurase [Pirellulales bacterium]|nr:cysteine desulfurase [Pirellulales bacterium]
MRLIYLDYNATTPVAPEVQEAMLPFLERHYGNPSSNHTLGRAAREAIEDARSRVAQLLGAERAEIVFTGGGTESNNLALKGVCLRGAAPSGRHLVISALEHPAVVEPARWLERLGVSVTVVPASRDGVISPEGVERALRPETVLVSVMHANNEIGTVQPIRALAERCRQRGVLVHTDAAQSVGKLAVRVEELGVDLLTVAGHKFYGPKGVGALYVRRGVELEPLLHGAGHEFGLRAGTENTAAIVGLGQAAALAMVHGEEQAKRIEPLRERLALQLREGTGGAIVVHGEATERLPNTLSVRFPYVSGATLLARANELCASTTAACHGQQSMSPTLAAIGLKPGEAQGTLRLSLGWSTTSDEVERAASLLLEAWEASR